MSSLSEEKDRKFAFFVPVTSPGRGIIMGNTYDALFLQHNFICGTIFSRFPPDFGLSDKNK
jgi:hypothetical protein